MPSLGELLNGFEPLEVIVKMSFAELLEWTKKEYPDCHVWKQTLKGRKCIYVKSGKAIMLINDGRKSESL